MFSYISQNSCAGAVWGGGWVTNSSDYANVKNIDFAEKKFYFLTQLMHYAYMTGLVLISFYISFPSRKTHITEY